jgi:hypothetical protein
MNIATRRSVFRWIHIIFSIPILGYIFSPAGGPLKLDLGLSGHPPTKVTLFYYKFRLSFRGLFR